MREETIFGEESLRYREHQVLRTCGVCLDLFFLLGVVKFVALFIAGCWVSSSLAWDGRMGAAESRSSPEGR